MKGERVEHKELLRQVTDKVGGLERGNKVLNTYFWVENPEGQVGGTHQQDRLSCST